METTPEKKSDEAVSAVKAPSSIVKWAIAVGIVIVSNLFIAYLVQALYHAPTYVDFCPQPQVIESIDTKEACLNQGGQWNANIDKGGPMPVAGYCDPEFTCRKGFEAGQSVYNRNVFAVFIVAGLVFLGAATFIVRSGAVALGLSFGGVLAFVIGSVRYWSDMDEYLRVVILGIAFVVLLWLGAKRFRDR